MKKKPEVKKHSKKVSIAKGLKVTKAKEAKMRKKPGGSNVGDYKSVAKKDFAGAAGGAPKGSFPINTLARARSALRLAHNAPNPQALKRKVYSKYPELKPSKKK